MYIVSIDIAKRFHEAAIIDRAGNVVVKRIRFANFHTGFLKLMEATGHYWVAALRPSLPSEANRSRDKPSAIRRLALHVYPSNKEQHN